MNKNLNSSNWKRKILAILLIGTYFLTPIQGSAEESGQAESSQETVEEIIEKINKVDLKANK